MKSDFINYVEKGEGDALILLHGNGENLSYFENNFNFFSAYYHVYALDSPSHGLSGYGEGPFTLERFSDDLYNFFIEKGIKDPNILGFSDGANIAILFALKHPGFASSLILNGANIFPYGLKTKTYKRIKSEWKIKKEENSDEFKYLNLMVKEPKLSFTDLETIKTPTLVIVGKNDEIKLSHSLKIAKAIKNSKFVILDGTHFIAYENPDNFNKEVLSFLKSVNKDKSS